MGGSARPVRSPPSASRLYRHFGILNILQPYSLQGLVMGITFHVLVFCKEASVGC
jgi:hypothetical protein